MSLKRPTRSLRRPAPSAHSSLDHFGDVLQQYRPRTANDQRGGRATHRAADARPLRPGQTADERKFRIRGDSRKLGLKMEADWSRLTFYPHHGLGSAAIKQRYAMREAMLTRLNGMEGIWNRLQAGKKIGTNDADRTRIRDKDGHDLLVDLALLSMTAATLANERQERGISVPPLPPVGPAPVGSSPAGAQARVTTSAGSANGAHGPARVPTKKPPAGKATGARSGRAGTASPAHRGRRRRTRGARDGIEAAGSSTALGGGSASNGSALSLEVLSDVYAQLAS